MKQFPNTKGKLYGTYLPNLSTRLTGFDARFDAEYNCFEISFYSDGSVGILWLKSSLPYYLPLAVERIVYKCYMWCKLLRSGFELVLISPILT